MPLLAAVLFAPTPAAARSARFLRPTRHERLVPGQTVEVEWVKNGDGRLAMKEKPGSEKVWPADLVLLAMGFVGPEKPGMLEELGVKLDPRGNVAVG